MGRTCNSKAVNPCKAAFLRKKCLQSSIFQEAKKFWTTTYSFLINEYITTRKNFQFQKKYWNWSKLQRTKGNMIRTIWSGHMLLQAFVTKINIRIRHKWSALEWGAAGKVPRFIFKCWMNEYYHNICYPQILNRWKYSLGECIDFENGGLV